MANTDRITIDISKAYPKDASPTAADWTEWRKSLQAIEEGVAWQDGTTNKTTEGFMTKEHAAACILVCNQRQLIITSRETGNYSIKCIRDGYPTKGHDILAKSIKPKSLGRKLEEVPKELVPYLGLVGSDWENMVPKGLFLARTNATAKAESGGVAVPFPRDNTPLNKSLLEQAYTGDYDLHDVLYGSTNAGTKRGTPVPSGEDMRLTLNELNVAMVTGAVRLEDDPKGLPDPRLSPESNRRKSWRDYQIVDPTHCSRENNHNIYSLVRHGPQRNYWSYMHGSVGEFGPKEANIVMEVFGYSPPIVVFCYNPAKKVSRNSEPMVDVFVLTTYAAIKEFYAELGQVPQDLNMTPSEVWRRYGSYIYARYSEEWLARSNLAKANKQPTPEQKKSELEWARRFHAWICVTHCRNQAKPPVGPGVNCLTDVLKMSSAVDANKASILDEVLKTVELRDGKVDRPQPVTAAFEKAVGLPTKLYEDKNDDFRIFLKEVDSAWLALIQQQAAGNR